MTDNIINSLDHDIQPVIAASRILALNAKHGFINLEHFFVAMLQTGCQAKPFLQDVDPEIHIGWLQALYPATGKQTPDDTLPLTMHAERIIRHATYLSSLEDNKLINSVHLLLAMLSYDNRVSELVKKKGIVFEDISASYAGGAIPKTPIELVLRHFNKPSRVVSFLRLAPSTESLLKEIHEHASNLWTYQQYDDCITTCQTGLEFKPDHRSLKTLLATCFLKQRKFSDAVGQLDELVNTSPDDKNFQLSLAYCYDWQDAYTKAEAILDKLLARWPDDDILLNNKGFNLQLQGRYAAAIPFYEQAIKVNPSFAYPYDNLGFVKYKLGHTEEALTLINKALELDKGNSFAYKYKGIILFEQGNKELAMEQFQLALKYGYTETYGEEVLQWIEKCR